MRKDAKIGFAIGGVLLAVLTVYAIVVPKHKTSNSKVSVVTPPAQSTDATPQTSLSAPVEAPTVVPPPAVTPAPTHSENPAPGTGSPSSEQPGRTTPPGDVARGDGPSHEAPETPVLPPDAPESHPRTPVRDRTLQREEIVDASAADKTYTIQPGETLSSIASRTYGNSRYWVAIQRENRTINPNNLKVGTTIKLPNIAPVQSHEPITGEVTRGNEVQVPAEYLRNAVTVADHETAPAPEPTENHVALDAHSYVVKPGDSLYKIAKTMLGSGRRAEAIYALNKDAIGPDKARLKLGMVLKLPQNAPGTAALDR